MQEEEKEVMVGRHAASASILTMCSSQVRTTSCCQGLQASREAAMKMMLWLQGLLLVMMVMRGGLD